MSPSGLGKPPMVFGIPYTGTLYSTPDCILAYKGDETSPDVAGSNNIDRWVNLIETDANRDMLAVSPTKPGRGSAVGMAATQAIKNIAADKDHFNLTAPSYISIPQPFTVYSVWEAIGAGASFYIYVSPGSFHYLVGGSNMRLGINAGTALDGVSIAAGLSDPHVVCAVFNGASSAIYIDNSLTANIAGNAGTGTFLLATETMSLLTYDDGSPAAADTFGGDFGAFSVFMHAASYAQRTDVMGHYASERSLPFTS